MPCGGRWSWSERWCPQKAVPGGRGDGCRRHSSGGGLPGPGRVDLGLLRLQVPAAIAAGHPPCLADRPDPPGAPGLSRDLWCASGPCRAAAGPRDYGRPQRRGAADAPRRPSRRYRAAEVAPCQARPDRRRSGRPQLHPQRAEPAVGDRYHRASHPRGQALLCGGAGCLLPSGGRLVDRCHPDRGAGHQRSRHGHPDPHPTGRCGHPLGPGRAGRIQLVVATPRSWRC
jgi:hypothetical protein